MAVTVKRDEVQELVTDVLVDAIGIDRELITPEATLESLEIDSIDLVEVAQAVEEKWGFRIRAQDAKGVETLGEAIDMIVKVGQSGSGDDLAQAPEQAGAPAAPLAPSSPSP